MKYAKEKKKAERERESTYLIKERKEPFFNKKVTLVHLLIYCDVKHNILRLTKQLTFKQKQKKHKNIHLNLMRCVFLFKKNLNHLCISLVSVISAFCLNNEHV